MVIGVQSTAEHALMVHRRVCAGYLGVSVLDVYRCLGSASAPPLKVGIHVEIFCSLGKSVAEARVCFAEVVDQVVIDDLERIHLWLETALGHVLVQDLVCALFGDLVLQVAQRFMVDELGRNAVGQ